MLIIFTKKEDNEINKKTLSAIILIVVASLIAVALLLLGNLYCVIGSNGGSNYCKHYILKSNTIESHLKN